MIIVLMGVSGCGKTTVGRLLAARHHYRFVDADDYHPESNVNKMRAGIPLDDRDRSAWLTTLETRMEEWISSSSDIVLAFSALKNSHRSVLRKYGKSIRLVFLKGSIDLIAGRLSERRGHYMNKNLLESQFEALEEPDDAAVISIDQSPERIVDQITMLDCFTS